MITTTTVHLTPIPSFVFLDRTVCAIGVCGPIWPHNWRLLSETGRGRWPPVHAWDPRHCWYGAIHSHAGFIYEERAGIHSGFLHHCRGNVHGATGSSYSNHGSQGIKNGKGLLSSVFFHTQAQTKNAQYTCIQSTHCCAILSIFFDGSAQYHLSISLLRAGSEMLAYFLLSDYEWKPHQMLYYACSCYRSCSSFWAVNH